MAEQEHTSIFKADVEGFVEPINTAAAALDFAASAGERAKSAFVAFDKSGNQFTQTLKLTTAGLQDVQITLKRTEEGWKVTSAAVSENSAKLRDQAKAARESAKAMQELAAFRSDFPGAGQSGIGQGSSRGQSARSFESAQAESAKQRERREAELNETLRRENRKTTEQMAKDWGDALIREAAQHEKFVRDSIARDRRLSAAIQKNAEAVSATLRARRDAENQQAAASFGRNQFTKLQPSLSGANPEEVLRVTSAIGSIQDKIASGSITSARAVQVMNNALAGQPQILNNVERQVASLALRTKVLGQETEKTTATMNLGWQTIARITAIQFIHRAIYTLIDAMRSAAKESIEFQIRISEIRTISQQNQLTFGQWSDAVRRLSDEFGKPIDDVAKATYETISNQIAQGAEATIFLEKALRFSQATVSTTAQSVDLLSSALNAYQLSAAETDRVSAIFFKTIDLGRVTAAEMANTFGRVAVPAAQLGVSLEEVTAALATLTINGVKSSEAMTQLNTLMVSLLKPSNEMKKFLKDQGVASGEAAIATFGFVDVVRKLGEYSKGSSTELAALVRNARGLRGALGLTSDLEGFEKNLAGIRAAGSEYSNAIGIATESAGFKVQQELNKLKNMFIFEFGIPLTKALATVSEAFGGLDVAVSRMIGTVTAAALTFTIYKSATVGAALSSRVLTSLTTLQAAASARQAIAEEMATGAVARKVVAERTLAVSLQARTIAETEAKAAGLSNEVALQAGTRAAFVAQTAYTGLAGAVRTFGLALKSIVTSPLFIIGGVVALWQIQKQRWEELERVREDTFNKLQAINTAELDTFRKSQEGARAAFEDSLNSRFRSYLQFAADVRKVTQNSADVEIAERKRVHEETRTLLDLSLNRQREAIREIESAQKESINNVKEAQRALDENTRRSGNRDYDRRLAIAPEEDKGQVLADRLAQLKKEAEQLFESKGANDLTEGIKRISDAMEILQERFRRNLIIRKQITELQKEQTELEARAGATSAKNAAQNNVRDLRNKGKSSPLFDARVDKDELQDAEEMRRIEARRAEIAEKLGKLRKEYGQNTVRPDAEENVRFQAEEAELLALQKRLTEELVAKEKERQQLLENQVNLEKERVARLQDAFKAITQFALPKSVDDKSLDASLKKFDALIAQAQTFGLTDQSVLFQLQKQRAEIAKAGNRQIELDNQESIVRQTNATRDQYIKMYGEIQTAQAKSLEERKKLEAEIQANITSIIQKAIESRGQSSRGMEGPIGALDELFDKIKAGGPVTPADVKGFSDVIEAFRKFDPFIVQQNADALGKTQEALSKLLKTSAESANADSAMQKFMQSAKDAKISLDGLPKSLQDAGAAGNKFGDEFNKKLDEMRLKTIQLNNALKDITRNQLGPGAPGDTQVPGFAIGGRGVDNMLAYVRAGEMVMNPGAVSSFYPLLKAMNLGGQNPQSFAIGGEVNFIGTNVNVQATGDVEVDARALWSRFQQMINRGEIKRH